MKLSSIHYINYYRSTLQFPQNGRYAYLLICPNLENMISKSSSVVTGFNLHTNKTFSGGLISASGISPTLKYSMFDVESMMKYNIWLSYDRI
jgi:hypothetical protein